MINPGYFALRRRSEELVASAEREMESDADTAALLLFYAVECGLKAVYMQQNNLKATDEDRGNAQSARSFGHNIRSLILALNISRSSIKPQPVLRVVRLDRQIDVAALHEAWRYGEKVDETLLVYDWLLSLIEWCRKNR